VALLEASPIGMVSQSLKHLITDGALGIEILSKLRLDIHVHVPILMPVYVCVENCTSKSVHTNL